MDGAPQGSKVSNMMAEFAGMLPLKGEISYKDPGTGTVYKVKIKKSKPPRFCRKKREKYPTDEGYELPGCPNRPLPPAPNGRRLSEPLEPDSNSDFEDPVYDPIPEGDMDWFPKSGKHGTSHGSDGGVPGFMNTVGVDSCSGQQQELQYEILELDSSHNQNSGDCGKESDELYTRLKRRANRSDV